MTREKSTGLVLVLGLVAGVAALAFWPKKSSAQTSRPPSSSEPGRGGEATPSPAPVPGSPGSGVVSTPSPAQAISLLGLEQFIASHLTDNRSYSFFVSGYLNGVTFTNHPISLVPASFAVYFKPGSLINVEEALMARLTPLVETYTP